MQPKVKTVARQIARRVQGTYMGFEEIQQDIWYNVLAMDLPAELERCENDRIRTKTFYRFANPLIQRLSRRYCRYWLRPEQHDATEESD
jgi:hypothetical protein